ncbi:MAG TPA: NUDIX hydrolase [Actinomycetota bacterium]
MTRVRDTFCSFCGTKYPEPLSYPRACAGCGTQVWANPIPVAVVLVQIVEGDRTGILVVRRNIPPQIGKLAIVGGFVEETGVIVAAETLQPMWYASSEPKPNRILMFSVAPPMAAESLPPFTTDLEASERGVVWGPGGIEDVFAFPLHIEAVRKYFGGRGITGPHDFCAR